MCTCLTNLLSYFCRPQCHPRNHYFQVDGRHLPRKRHRIYNGELTLENLRKSDHGIYECVVANEVKSHSAIILIVGVISMNNNTGVELFMMSKVLCALL